MVENSPSNFGEEPDSFPPTAQSLRTPPSRPAERSPTWLSIPLATIATAIAVVALTVSLTRSSSQPTTTYPAEATASAHQTLCDAYHLAARAVQIETNGTSAERAGIAEVNGAMLLQQAANEAPALTSGDRSAAIALAHSYNNIAAVASLNEHSAWRSALDEANAKDAKMKKVCGVG